MIIMCLKMLIPNKIRILFSCLCTQDKVITPMKIPIIFSALIFSCINLKKCSLCKDQYSILAQQNKKCLITWYTTIHVTKGNHTQREKALNIYACKTYKLP